MSYASLFLTLLNQQQTVKSMSLSLVCVIQNHRDTVTLHVTEHKQRRLDSTQKTGISNINIQICYDKKILFLPIPFNYLTFGGTTTLSTVRNQNVNTFFCFFALRPFFPLRNPDNNVAIILYLFFIY